MKVDVMNMGAVVMVGGSGKRMGALTENRPKPLLKIGHYTILDHILRAIETLGVQRKDVVVVAKYLAEQIDSHLSKKGFSVITGRQNNIVLNLIDVLPYLPESFITASSDLYTLDLLEEAVNVHWQSKADATLIIARLDDHTLKRKYWHYTIEAGYLKNLNRGNELTDWERDIMILKRAAVEKISDKIKKVLEHPSSEDDIYKKFSNGWNLVLKLLLDEGLKVRILQKESCRCFRINVPEDLKKAVLIIEAMKLKVT